MSTVIDTLICDRTQADVDRVFTLKNQILTQGFSSLTADEQAEYLAGMKGAYNYTDMNRVGQAVSYIAERMSLIGIENVNVSPKTDWVMGDTPTQSQVATYLANLTELRSKITVPEDTPAVPTTLDNMTYGTANDIEELLVVMDECINRTIVAFDYAGILYCGE